MSNPICVWDFTIGSKYIEFNNLTKILDKHCKKWCFQLEKGKETNFEHFQGRFSLDKKRRIGSCKKLFNCPEIHLSPTSKANMNNMFYVQKEETRIDGPWNDEDDEKIYITDFVRQLKEFRPWQQSIIEMSKLKEFRTINVIIDKNGNNGKSLLSMYMFQHKMARNIPFVNNYKDLMRAVCSMPTAKVYIMDMPRAMPKSNLENFYAAIESVKNGYVWDDRYKFTEKTFDSPQIFVFSNTVPDSNLLSRDRWKYWTIENNKLVKYVNYSSNYTELSDNNETENLAKMELDMYLGGNKGEFDLEDEIENKPAKNADDKETWKRNSNKNKSLENEENKLTFEDFGFI
jgi:hypothetical protein